MIVIDEKFRDLIQSLDSIERAWLEKNLQDAGRARSPLIVWPVNGQQILIDGHNRYDICTEYDLPYTVEEIEFANRAEAEEWILREQLGRRNLDPVVSSELRGRLYNARKGSQGGDRRSKGQNVTLNAAESVAAETGVDARTVKRDGQFAEAIDKVREVVPEIQSKLRAREVTKADVIQAAAQVDAAPAEVARQLRTPHESPAKPKRERLDLWLCLIDDDPMEIAEVAVNKLDPTNRLTGCFVFSTQGDALAEGEKHYDPESVRAVTVAEFLKESAGL